MTELIRIMKGLFPRTTTRIWSLALRIWHRRLTAFRLWPERTRAIKMITGSSKVTIATSSPDLGSASEEVEAKYEGDSIEIGYNFRYLLDILNEIKGDSVRVSFTDGTSPSVIS